MVSELFAFFIGSLSYFVLQVSSGQKFPKPLSHEEETLLFQRLHNTGDAGARASLIEHNLRLVAHIVRKYYAAHTSQDDLISIGTIGLIKAVDSYSDKNGARFATYAAKCIQNEILMYFRSQKKTSCEVSINETIDTDRDGNPLTYIDIIRVEDTIADDISDRWQIARAIRYIKDKLTDRERQIIIMRYGLDNKRPATQREVAEQLGISRSYVSRIEKNVLARIYKFLHGGET